MESRRLFCTSFLLVLLSCQYGVSYRIYILPEPSSFCLGVFSEDACLTWSEYSVRPTFVAHSTSLFFTPGNYSYQSDRISFSMANVKRLTLTGDRAHILFPLSISNVRYVGIHNLTFANNSQVNISNVQTFLMENCTLSQTSSVGLYLSVSTMNRIVESTFVNTSIEAQSRSTLLVNGSKFSNVIGTCIKGDYSSNVVIHSSVFVNNYQSRYYSGIIHTESRGSLRITDCLFDRNSAVHAIVYSNGKLIVTNCTFDKNEATYYELRGGYYNLTYYRGGNAIRGQRNIYISNCSFRYYTSTTINSDRDGSYYSIYIGYQVYIMNSNFYHSTGSIFSYNNVMVLNSVFYNITSAVHSLRPVTTINCTFIKSKSSGSGRVIYSYQNITVSNSTLIRGSLYSQQSITVTDSQISGSIATGSGGAVYSEQSVTLTRTNITNSVSQSGRGGAIYGLSVTIINSTVRDIVAAVDGGAVYSLLNVIIVNSQFVNTSVLVGNGGAIYSENDVKVIGGNISQCSALNGNGGAIYSAASHSETTFNPHSEPNIVLSGSNFIHSRALSGGVLYVSGHYNHRMEFNCSTFAFNEAIGNLTGGGVAFMGNTSLSITNSTMSNNMATTDGGVLDVSFSSVSIQRSSLSQNTAVNNGGVFYGRNYSTNITTTRTSFNHNVAANGGVFYVRRFNSNVKLVNSTFVGNHATSQGGIMDIRGATAVIDKDTIITNNSADLSGNVISACVSEISAYGLKVQLDPTYPMYCSLYDEEYSESGTSVSATNQTPAVEQVSTTIQATDQENTVTESTSPTTTEGNNEAAGFHKGGEIVTSIQTNSLPLITTLASSDKTSDAHTRVSTLQSHITPSTLIATTQPRSWTELMTAGSDEITSWQQHSLTTSTTQRVSTELPPLTDSLINSSEKEMMTTDETDTGAPLAPTVDLTSSSDDDGSTTKSTITLASPIGRGHSTESYEDDYRAWTSSQHDLFRVAVVCLVVLCGVFIAVCVIMAVLIFMACKKRSVYVRGSDQGYYRSLPLTYKDQDETKNEIKEHSFIDIKNDA